MKIVKNLVVLSFVFISSIAYGMDVEGADEMEIIHPQETAVVQTYFSPVDRKAMTDDLFSRLDSAKRSIYVAMYWITNDSILDKLIAAKKRNVRVEVCIDETSPNLHAHIQKLRNNNIMATVFSSKNRGNGIMHNKFLIIDSDVVITGSANFTRPAMDTRSKKFNYENMLILVSPKIAAEYLKAFKDIQKASSLF